MKRLSALCLVLFATLAFAANEPAQQTNPVVTLATTLGNIQIELLAKEAPISTANFLSYVDNGFYNGVIFHRVIPNFMVQTGGYTTTLQEKPAHAPIKNEAANGLHNTRGTLAMARTDDADSATSQFFINTVDNVGLDHTAQNMGYAVFGHVISGMDVVDKISAQPTGSVGFMQDVPRATIIITNASRNK